MAKDSLKNQRESKWRQPISPIVTTIIIVVIVAALVLIYAYQSKPHGKRLSYRQMGMPTSAMPGTQTRTSPVRRMAPPSGVAP